MKIKSYYKTTELGKAVLKHLDEKQKIEEKTTTKNLPISNELVKEMFEKWKNSLENLEGIQCWKADLAELCFNGGSQETAKEIFKRLREESNVYGDILAEDFIRVENEIKNGD